MTSYGPVTGSTDTMPFTPLISRVTLLARPTSVWIRMNALTTSTSSSGSRGIVRQAPDAARTDSERRSEHGVDVRRGAGQRGRGQRDPRDGPSGQREQRGADVQG